MTERARRIVAAALIAAVAAALALAVLRGGIASRWIGGSDSANTVVVARNLLRGRGFTVDHILYYSRQFEGIAHPEDSYPLLHPALVAGLALITRDVVTAAHLLSALLLFAYLGVLPLIALRRYGPTPALVLVAALLAQEQWTYFDRPLNDPGAMVLFAFAAMELLRSSEPDGDAALHRGAALAVAATLFKTSVAFFVVGVVVALAAMDGRSARERLRRGALVLGAVALGHVPVLLWHLRAFGEIGLPQQARVRGLARAIGAEEDFWTPWERFRTYLPAHPDAVPPLRETIWPFGRVAKAIRHAFLLGEVVPLTWIAACLVATRAARARIAAWVALACMLSGLLLAAYSHYEARYLHPLRPLIAIVAMAAARDVAERLDERGRIWMDRIAASAFALLAGAGLAGISGSQAAWPHVVAGLAGAAVGLAILRVDRWAAIAPAAAAMVVLVVALGARLPSGARALSRAGSPRSNPDLALGRWIAEHTAPGEAIMARRVVELSFFADRPMVITPYHPADVCLAAETYGVRPQLVEEDEPQLHDLDCGR